MRYRWEYSSLSKEKMKEITDGQYTMMGDTVNLAARLESAAKQYGIFTMISHNTYDLVKDSFEVRQLDKILVVGKSQPVIIYEQIAQKGALPTNFHRLLPIYNEGLEYFYAKELKS